MHFSCALQPPHSSCTRRTAPSMTHQQVSWMHDTIRLGDLEGVRKGLKFGISPNASNGINTALPLAVYYQYPDIVTLLLDAGATRTSEAVMNACLKQNMQMVQLLLRGGTRIDSSRDARPILYAVDYCTAPHARILQALLHADRRSSKHVCRYFALSIKNALERERMDMVDLLLQHRDASGAWVGGTPDQRAAAPRCVAARRRSAAMACRAVQRRWCQRQRLLR